MKKEISLSEADIDRIIEMAWEDRTTFDAIKSQYDLKEQDVKEIMRSNLINHKICRYVCTCFC